MLLSSTASLPAVGRVGDGRGAGWVLSPLSPHTHSQPLGAMLGQQEGGTSQKLLNHSQPARRPARGSVLASQYH